MSNKMYNQDIQIVLLDIDGVVTNGKVFVDSDGKEIKQIDFKDLDGAFELKRMGLKLGFVTKEKTPITEFFKKRFEPDIFYSGISNKLEAIDKICADYSVKRENICYMGDGKYDIEGVASVGLGCCPQNAIPEVQEVAKLVLSKKGGDGCVWELVRHFKANAGLLDSLLEHIDVINLIKLDKSLQNKIITVADAIAERYERKGRVFLAGNGGSASDAQHIATEFVSRFYFNRPSLDAECLAGNMSALTALGNDYGFEQVFSRQLSGKAGENDVFIGITTSGNSQNIIKALEVAKEKSTLTIALLGEHTPKEIERYCDFIINVPSKITPRVQECHIFIGHVICELVEKKLFWDEYGNRAT